MDWTVGVHGQAAWVRSSGSILSSPEFPGSTLSQGFGSAANLNIHLHCLVLDDIYLQTAAEPVFQEARATGGDELQGLLKKIVARLMKMLIGQGNFIEEPEMIYLAATATDNLLALLQAASCTYRIAFRPRAGQKVLSLRTVAGRDEIPRKLLRAEAQGFSLHALVRCGAGQRKELERLWRNVTRPAIANERSSCNPKGQLVLQLKSPPRDSTIVVTKPANAQIHRSALLG